MTFRGIDGVRHISVQEHQDACLLADAYLSACDRLAGVPRDAGEAVTEEWLLASGFRFLSPFREYEHPCGLRYHAPVSGSPAYWSLKNLCPLPRFKSSRSDVRCLCAALGIPLTE